MDAGLWACGTLSRAHGLDGELYLDLLPDGLDYLTAGERFFLSGEGGEELPPVRLRRTGGSDRRPLVRLEGVDTREAAIAVQGALVLASAATLDEGGFVAVSQLVGMRAVSGDEELGTVCDVLMNPAHDILEIERADGRRVLVPFVAELVGVDLAGAVLRIREGLL